MHPTPADSKFGANSLIQFGPWDSDINDKVCVFTASIPISPPLSVCIGRRLNHSLILLSTQNVVVTYAGMKIGGDYVFDLYNFIGINIRLVC